MKIAVTYRNYSGESYTRWIDEVLEAGIEYMEIATPELPEQREEQDEVIRYALAKGLKLNLHAPYGINNISSTDASRRASSIANAKAAIDLAATHGLGVVTFHPGRLSAEGDSIEENRVLLREVLADIAGYAKQRQVYVGLENMEDRLFEYIHDINDLNDFAHLTDENPYFGATVDFGHYATLKRGLPPLETLRLPLLDVHLSRYNGVRAHQPLLLDDAEELCDIVRSLQKYGYGGLVVLEVGICVLESVSVFRRVLEMVKKEAFC